jgi:hypothetical protein
VKSRSGSVNSWLGGGDPALVVQSWMADAPPTQGDASRSPGLSTASGSGSGSVAAHAPPSIHGPGYALTTLGCTVAHDNHRRLHTTIRHLRLVPPRTLTTTGSAVPSTDSIWLLTMLGSALAPAPRSSTHGQAPAALSSTVLGSTTPVRVRLTIQPVFLTS